MTRKRNKQSDSPGEDAFLDVVANLVGILIILVMVIGAQAQDTWQKAASEEQPQSTTAAKPAPEAAKITKPPSIDLNQLQQTALEVEKNEQQVTDMQSSNMQLERRIKHEDLTANLLVAERNAIQLTVLQMESAIKELESKQSQQIQQRLAIQAEQFTLQRKLEELQSQVQMADARQTSVETLEHQPTPISRTVFGEEIHFRLSGGRVTYVPLQELVMLVKSEIELKGRHLPKGEAIRSTVGPIDNFRMQYVLKATEVTVRQNDMMVRRKMASVEKFVLLPTRAELGEDMQQATSDNSSMLQRLALADPESTTISIWVYPDSFAEYRRLKDLFTDRGFMTATWPLPTGQPISGSPNGFKSSAQ